jgi:manganese transport protein
LYILAEIAIAATDLAEVVGMAIGLHLLTGLPLIWGVAITVVDTFLFLLLQRYGIRKMEAFILALVATIGVSFFIEILIADPNLAEVATGFIPTPLTDASLYIAVGIIGATVMPHNLYLHSSLVQTRKIKKDEAGIKKAIRFNFFDSTIALNAAFFVNAAILILAAAAFHKNGFNEVADIADAHKLLEGIFGTMAPTLFAIALIAAGQSSTITGTLAGQIVMEGYLNLRISPWVRRLVTRLIAVLPAVITISYFGEDKLGELLILSQVILSLQLGFAVIPLIHFTSSKGLMGIFANSTWVKVLAWVSAVIIVGLNIKLVGEEVATFLESPYAEKSYLTILLFAVLIYAAVLLLYVTFVPLVKKELEKRLVPHLPVRKLDLSKPNSFERVAITVDFTTFDEASIQHALNMGNEHTHYFLIHIVESAAAKRHGEEVMDIETKHDLESIQSYAHDLKEAGYQVEYKMGFGNRAENIAIIVEETQVQLLVMGAHGHAGLKDLVFGSTVDAVRHKVKIPILVVR